VGLESKAALLCEALSLIMPIRSVKSVSFVMFFVSVCGFLSFVLMRKSKRSTHEPTIVLFSEVE
jgi:hypothetical protein